MDQSVRLADLVQRRLDGFLDERTSILSGIADEVARLGDFSRQFLRGGKRFRALFCYWGWQAVQDGVDPMPEPSGRDLDTVVTVATALELFHAAALVHDDVIDSSDTRRGAPSTHRHFEREFVRNRYAGDAAAFGRAAAILIGDLLLSWSDELLTIGLAGSADPAAARAARTEYDTMRLEVTAGQFLDVVEQGAWPVLVADEMLPRANRVVLYKSAKYSVEAPLLIGASLGGASVAQLTGLRSFGVPLGVAYQLRDDLLGVFGDSEVTGKPSGDDLVEGKRTVLIALARAALPPGARRSLDELLGDPDLSADQIRLLQATIRGSGAVDRVELMITDNVRKATAALAAAPLSLAARSELTRLAEAVSNRTH